jgi:hypothetical protein
MPNSNQDVEINSGGTTQDCYLDATLFANNQGLLKIEFQSKIYE